MLSSVRVYVGIGSNIDAEKNVQKALQLLEKQFGPLLISPEYYSPAMGFEGDDFINLVVGFRYSVSSSQPISSLKTLLIAIENLCGRCRESESGMGARPMDIDLLTYGALKGMHEGLVLPRSDVYERHFVYEPFKTLLNALDELSEFESSLLEQMAQL